MSRRRPGRRPTCGSRTRRAGRWSCDGDRCGPAVVTRLHGWRSAAARDGLRRGAVHLASCRPRCGPGSCGPRSRRATWLTARDLAHQVRSSRPVCCEPSPQSVVLPPERPGRLVKQAARPQARNRASTGRVVGGRLTAAPLAARLTAVLLPCGLPQFRRRAAQPRSAARRLSALSAGGQTQFRRAAHRSSGAGCLTASPPAGGSAQLRGRAACLSSASGWFRPAPPPDGSTQLRRQTAHPSAAKPEPNQPCHPRTPASPTNCNSDPLPRPTPQTHSFAPPKTRRGARPARSLLLSRRRRPWFRDTYKSPPSLDQDQNHPSEWRDAPRHVASQSSDLPHPSAVPGETRGGAPVVVRPRHRAGPNERGMVALMNR